MVDLSNKDQSPKIEKVDSPAPVKKKRRWWIKVLIGFLVILIVIGGIGAILGLQAKAFYEKALGLQPSIEKVKGNLTSQDLLALKTSLEEFISKSKISKNHTGNLPGRKRSRLRDRMS